MKTELEVEGDELKISTLTESLIVYIDVVTGMVTSISYVDEDIHTVEKFMRRAKTRYNSFLRSEQINDFI